MWALANRGDLEETRRHAAAMLAPAERLRDRFWLAGAPGMNETVYRLAGNCRIAHQFSDRDLEAAPGDARLLGARTTLECEVGNLEDGRVYLERLLEVMRLAPLGPTVEFLNLAIAAPIVARITGMIVDLDVAQAAAETVLSSPWVSPLFASGATMALAFISVLRADMAAAAKHYNYIAGESLPPHAASRGLFEP